MTDFFLRSQALGANATLVTQWPRILRSLETAVEEARRPKASTLSTSKWCAGCSMCWLIVSFFCGVFMTVFGFAKDNPTLGYVGVMFLGVLVITIGTMVCSFVKMDATAKNMNFRWEIERKIDDF